MKYRLGLAIALVMAGVCRAEVAATGASTLPAVPGGAIFVEGAGDDAAAGTREQPVKTLRRALAALKPGGAVVLRGGTYAMETTITLKMKGEEGKACVLMAYPGEVVKLDFEKATGRGRGITVAGDWWEVKGLEIAHGHGGMYVTGSHVVIERCATHDNTETGMQFGEGASHVKVINCDSYDNADPSANYANADGFAPKLTVGDDVSFYGCRSWGNCDDGWDGYMRGANNVTTVLENCWAFRNGWLKDGTDPGPQANGNGFKLGGGDNGNAERLMHHFVLKNCLAFGNKVKGFDQNNNVGSMTMINCTGFKNGGGNFKFWKELEPGQKLILKHCISDGADAWFSGALREEEGNSWQLPLPDPYSSDDFESVEPEGVTGPRKADGSLPEIRFLRVKADGKLARMGYSVRAPGETDTR